MTEKTERGFGRYATVDLNRDGERVRVQESSRAFEGAHVWVIFDGIKEIHHLGRHIPPMAELTVEQAEELIDGLSQFVRHARDGELTEPA